MQQHTGWGSGSRDTGLHSSRVAQCGHGEQFIISEPDEVHLEADSIAALLTALVEMSKLVVMTHFMMSQLRHDQQQYLTNNQIIL